METVGRALAGARNGGGPAVPNTEFDFQRANAMFDKPHTEQKEEKDKAYDPQKSFFDSLTGGGGGGGSGGRGRGRGGAAGRNRREEERERNVATFGEPAALDSWVRARMWVAGEGIGVVAAVAAGARSLAHEDETL